MINHYKEAAIVICAAIVLYPILVALGVNMSIGSASSDYDKVDSLLEDHVITSADTLILARIIHSECSICDTIEQQLVGSVFLNRVYNRRHIMYIPTFGDDLVVEYSYTFKEIALQKSQFAGAVGNNYECTPESWYIAKKLLSDPLYITPNITHFVTKAIEHTSFAKNVKKQFTIRAKHHIYF